MNRIKYKSLFTIIYITIITSACCRQKLEDSYFIEGNIPISVDWEISGISPQNVSVLFYNEDDGSLALEHYYENNNNKIQSYVSLPKGNYNVVLFNELPGQIRNMNIEAKKNFSTLMAVGEKQSDIKKPIIGANYFAPPGELASVIIRNFEVKEKTHWISSGGSESAVPMTNKSLLNLIPTDKISLFELKVNVEGINNARMPAMVSLHNASGSYLFDENNYGKDPVSYEFPINKPDYNPKTTSSGFLFGNTFIFGLPGIRTVKSGEEENPVFIDISFILVNSEIVTRHLDITNKMKLKESNCGIITLYVDVDLGEPLPDVLPDNKDSDFETSVDAWDVININMIAR